MNNIEATGIVLPTYPRTIVEAGHLYEPNEVIYKPERSKLTDEVVGHHILMGLQVGQRVVSTLQQAGFNTLRAAFVDDTWIANHPARLAGDPYSDLKMRLVPYRYVTSLGYFKAGWTPRIDFRELEIEQPALQLVEKIKEVIENMSEFRLTQDRRRIVFKQDGKRQTIKLLGKDLSPRGYDPDFPSCEVLDMALYRRKLQLAQAAITVLPESYKSQQDRVKKLFEILREKPSVAVVYFSDESQITEVDPWNNSVEPFKEVLKAA